MTAIHRRLHDTLWEMGFDVADEVRVGPYFLDCFVTELWLGFEADGQLYHKGRQAQKDADRDAWIADNFGIVVLRVSDYDLKRVSDPETVGLIEAFIDEHGNDIAERREIAYTHGLEPIYQ